MCPNNGDVQENMDEANLRLNAWLRTRSPPKRFSQSIGNSDRSYGKNSRGGPNGRSSGNWRRGKGSAMDDPRFDKRWKKICSSSQRKIEGHTLEPKRCMETNKTLKEGGGNPIIGEKSCDADLMYIEEIQVDLSKEVGEPLYVGSGSNNINAELDLTNLVIPLVGNSDTIGPHTHSLKGDQISIGPEEPKKNVLSLGLSFFDVVKTGVGKHAPTKTHATKKWKRVARELS